jgi:Skp family chaperone for outer membrane proteins
MKRVNFIATTLLLVFFFALPLFAQTAPTKICFISTGAFSDEKQGITKVVSALAALDKEFEPRQKELVDINTRVENLAKEIQGLQTQLNNAAAASKTSPINVEKLQSDIAAKNDEGARLQIDFKRKQEDAKTAYEKRRAVILEPVQKEIFNAINEFAKARGFDVILDYDVLAQGLVYVAQPLDMTPDFIKFFNAKPATTATTTAPATKPAGTAAKPN